MTCPTVSAIHIDGWEYRFRRRGGEWVATAKYRLLEGSVITETAVAATPGAAIDVVWARANEITTKTPQEAAQAVFDGSLRGE